MNAKFLVVGASALGFMAMTGVGGAMPVSSLGAIATDSSVVTQAHFSKTRHIHRGQRIVWLSEKPGEKMITGRSVSKQKTMTGRSVSKKKKHMKKMETPSTGQSSY